MNVFVMICGKFLKLQVTLGHFSNMDRLKTDKVNAKLCSEIELSHDYISKLYYENE